MMLVETFSTLLTTDIQIADSYSQTFFRPQKFVTPRAHDLPAIYQKDLNLQRLMCRDLHELNTEYQLDPARLKPLGYRVALTGKSHVGPGQAYPFEKVAGGNSNASFVENSSKFFESC